jgi:histidyl-tRNA synthetase
MNIQKPKGTFDILPEDAFKRHFIYEKLRSTFYAYNYKEILTPAFEKTELFKRGIGEETDIVSKEMYSFNEDEFTLRPEMTAPAIRAYLENSLYNEAPLKKLFYICNMFRRERPQAGRYREFWQFGVEAIGSKDIIMDAELIALAASILNAFGIKDTVTKINTIGSPDERKKYISDFKEYLTPYLNELSNDSKVRFEKNPLRILDTKNEKDREILADAPVLYESLMPETKESFEKLLRLLEDLKINYQVDHKLVRGLDYYTDTTFEVISDSLGAQNTILGGGRYDRLISQLGGKETPAIGFACGIERLMMVMQSAGFEYPAEGKLNLYLVTSGEKARAYALRLVTLLREMKMHCETDYLGRSIKAQMKEANRLEAEYVIVIGDNELTDGFAKIKQMSDSKEEHVVVLNQVNTPDYIINYLHKETKPL